MPLVPQGLATSSLALSQYARAYDTAIERFKHKILSKDVETIEGTRMEDVWKVLKDIQGSENQAPSPLSPNRLEPFLKDLEQYSKLVEVACNGTSYLPWIWVSCIWSSKILVLTFA
jgi:hypothetical protein